MSDERSTLDHLLLGIEEMLRAGAEAAAVLRARTREGADPALPRPFLDALRGALAREVARWELRGEDDPAARRVRDLFEAILDVIEPPRAPADEPEPQGPRARPEDRTHAPGTRAPRRGVQR